MTNALRATLESKKFITAILTSGAAAALHFGWHLDPALILAIISPIGIAIGAQGWADGAVASAAAELKIAELEAGQTHAQMAAACLPAPVIVALGTVPPHVPAPQRTADGGFVDVRLLGIFAMFTALIVTLTIIVSCATFSKDAKVAAGAFAACEKVDLGAIVKSTGATLLGQVATIIETNGASLESDLDQLASAFTSGAIACAIAAVDAVVTAKPSTPAASSAIQPPIEGVERADAWVRGHAAAK